ncbi:unnamed protein product [Symbiodinium natans]|uniref:Uncharacterized protein n=1 Tax=Symbiodinium natans TaxID=878477 RepID=A0A812RDX7_9DINO|nr:unnamed protein product [Symbiodinium natans]
MAGTLSQTSLQDVRAHECEPKGEDPLAPRASTPDEGKDFLVADALSSDDMRLLFQLQVINSQLRSELSLEDEDLPQVESQTDEFVDQLRRAALEGHLLKSELKSLEKELSRMAANLTEDELNKCAENTQTPLRRSSADLVEQGQQVTRQTIELSSCYEERVRRLEAELHAAAASQLPPQGAAPVWMLQQLQVLEADCELLEMSYAQAQEKRKELEDRVLQRLHMEQQSQLKDIGNLTDIVSHSKRDEPAPSVEPLKEEAAQLRAEAERLRAQRAKDQAQASQQSTALRQELCDLQDHCQQALARRSRLEANVKDLKNSHSNFANTSREVLELRRDKELLDKDRQRMERRIAILDAKIESLQKEAEDLRQRACVVMSSMPEQAATLGDAQVWQLQDALQQKQLQVQELRRRDARALREQDEAHQLLETAQVDASVLERKIRHLSSRSPPVQA